VNKKYHFVTCTSAVRYALICGGWWTGPSMQKEVKRLTGNLYSESGITARIRELRSEFHIPSRLKDESTSFEYRIADRPRFPYQIPKETA
jgi:hypothetical protein